MSQINSNQNVSTGQLRPQAGTLKATRETLTELEQVKSDLKGLEGQLKTDQDALATLRNNPPRVGLLGKTKPAPEGSQANHDWKAKIKELEGKVNGDLGKIAEAKGKITALTGEISAAEDDITIKEGSTLQSRVAQLAAMDEQPLTDLKQAEGQLKSDQDALAALKNNPPTIQFLGKKRPAPEGSQASNDWKAKIKQLEGKVGADQAKIAEIKGEAVKNHNLPMAIREAEAQLAQDKDALGAVKSHPPTIKVLGKDRPAPQNSQAYKDWAGKVKELEGKVAGDQVKLDGLVARKTDLAIDGKKDVGTGKIIAQVNKLDAEIKKDQDALATEVKALDQLNGDKAGVQGQLADAEKALAATQAEQANDQKALAVTNGSITKLSGDIKGLESANTDLAAASTKLKGEIEALGKERIGLLRETGADQGVYDALKGLPANQLTEADKKFLAGFEAKKARIAAIGTAIGGKNDQIGANDQTIAGNKAKLTALNTELNGLIGKKSDLEGQIAGNTKELAAIKDKIGGLEGKVKDLDAKIRFEQQKIGDLKEEISSETAQRNGLLDTAIGEKQDELGYDEGIIGKLDARIEALDGQLKEANGNLSALQGEREDTLAEIDSLTKKSADLSGANQQLQAELDATNQKLTANTGKIKELDTQIAKDTKTTEGLGAERIDLLRQTGADQGVYDALKGLPANQLTVADKKFLADFDTKKARITTIGGEIGKLNDGIASAQQSKAALRTENKGLKDQATQLNVSITQNQGTIEGLKGEIAAANKELGVIDVKLQQVTARIGDLQGARAQVGLERFTAKSEQAFDAADLARLQALRNKKL